MDIDVSIFHQAFFEEATDLLADFERLLLRLEETPGDTDLLNTIFRCAHSIKGGSSTFGFPEIAHFTHDLETLLDRVRNGQVSVSREIVQVLLESLDQLRALFAVAKGEATEAPNADGLTKRIQKAADATSGGAPLESKAEPASESWGLWAVAQTYRLTFHPGVDVLKQGSDPLLLLAQLASEAQILAIRCDEEHLPTLQDMDPESCYVGWEVDFTTDREPSAILEIFEFIADESVMSLIELESEVLGTSVLEVVDTLSDTPQVVERAAVPKLESATLRVAADKLDKLINLVGELVINQSMLNEVTQGFTMEKLPRLLEAVESMARASRELQERAMAIRMVPIRQAFARFPRMVRDLSATCGKQIDFRTIGDETELDKTLIEAIGDPLTHLVRNAIDHGVETPEERLAVGKSATAIVSIEARHEGGGVIIEVSDDGKGLDATKILAKARERGLLAEDEAAPSDEIIQAFIFKPGFSTASEITDVSGRGVGMDIVRQAIQGLNGSITLATELGSGTRFRVRLPLTMAILEGLSLSVGDEVYVLPLTSIVESIQPVAKDIHFTAGDSEVVQVRGQVLPIVRLHRLFGAKTFIQDPTKGLLVIVEHEGRQMAMLVDELIGQSQVVIKSMETNYRKVDGVAGATILGDGRVALILDVSQLFQMQGGQGALAA